MAVPKPNYTQTPNRFIDEYMNQVSPAATKIYLTICRKTIGWHKDTEDISLSQIVKLTGLSKNTALRATEELEQFNLINVIRKGTGRRATNNYELNFEYINEPENSMENGSQNELFDENGKGNGSNSEPINPVIGSKFEPINPVNGSNFEQTKEIVLKKESKEILEPADSDITHEIISLIQEGSKQLTGKPYYHDGKEAGHVALLKQRYMKDRDLFIKLLQRFHYLKKNPPNNYWADVAFTPSIFNSNWNKLLHLKLPASVVAQEEQKHRSEWDELMDRYGGYEDEKLKYLLRSGSINQKEYEYIKDHQVGVPA